MAPERIGSSFETRTTIHETLPDACSYNCTSPPTIYLPFPLTPLLPSLALRSGNKLTSLMHVHSHQGRRDVELNKDDVMHMLHLNPTTAKSRPFWAGGFGPLLK